MISILAPVFEYLGKSVLIISQSKKLFKPLIVSEFALILL
jgi:hypothetical protein